MACFRNVRYALRHKKYFLAICCADRHFGTMWYVYCILEAKKNIYEMLFTREW